MNDINEILQFLHLPGWKSFGIILVMAVFGFLATTYLVKTYGGS